MLEGEGSRFIELDIGGTHKLTTSISTLTKVFAFSFLLDYEIKLIYLGRRFSSRRIF